MQVQFYTPHILLQEFVNCIMVVHAEMKPGEVSVIAYPPTPQCSLFFYINDPLRVQKKGETDFVSQPRSVVVGLQTSRVVLDVSKSHKAVRVGFHPGGLHRLLGFSMVEMIDGSYDAADIFGKEILELDNRLQEADTFDAIKAVIEQFLLRKADGLKRALPFDKAMLELLRFNGNLPIEQVASLACLSLRQFERLSIERIGMTPKVYARLARFSKAYRLREKFPRLSWTRIAHECGYFDQMHFIREFKAFAGFTPGVIGKELEGTPLRMQADMRL
ncbi:MAG: helix-turn-helix domain-containing protein [Terrimonas sp.]|nr:helix-turn-helix domain-containing protein [Terrimonas sp.]